MGARQLFIYVIFSYFDREKKLYTTFHRYLFLRHVPNQCELMKC